ncbi:DNA polymerase III subunit beta [Buchnera aphidicola]|uniref:DNA polymerase III subunit beta n=1 Tax=Buchnera aphidicola TaxID=9 RepID=UPI003464965E
MKFTINKKTFLKSLQKLNSIISITHENEATKNILLDIHKNHASFFSTNIELELIDTIYNIKIEKPGKILVSGKKILNVIRSFPNNTEIKIEIIKEIMKIKYKNICFMLKTLTSNIFPKYITEKDTYNIHIQQNILKKIIENTYFSMSKNDIRHYLNGINIIINKNKIISVATDGYRMAISEFNNVNFKKKLSIIIPRKTILEILKLLNNVEKKITINFGEKSIKFILDNYTISSRMIDHNFPNYKNLLIQDFDNKIKIPKEKIKQALNRSAIITDKNFQGVRIKFHKGLCNIHSKNEYEEEILETFEIEYYEPSITLTININYLLDVINVIDNDVITILLSKKNDSIYIQHLKQCHSFYIIMPLIL